MAHMIAGAPDLQQQCIYREVNQHIHRLAASYQNNDIISFLRVIFYSLS